MSSDKQNDEHIIYTSVEGAKALNKVFEDYVKQEQDTSIQPDYERLKQIVLEEQERQERNSSAKVRNPMRHLTPKKKKRR